MWFLFIIFFAIVSPINVFGQTSPPLDPTTPPASPTTIQSPTPTINPAFELFEQYKKDQKYNQDLYQQAYLDYVQKKQVYTKYGTLTTQQEKIDATKKALIARNNAIRTYLIAVRVDLDKYKDSNPTETNKYQIELSKLESWLNEQNSIVSTLNNDDDIRKWANEFNQKYISIQQTMYTSLVLHQSNLRLQNLKSIQSLANEIKNSPENQGNIDWVGNLTIKSDRVKSSLDDAFAITQTKQNEFRFSPFYDSSKIHLNKASQYLIDMLSDLKSIVIKFKQ